LSAGWAATNSDRQGSGIGYRGVIGAGLFFRIDFQTAEVGEQEFAKISGV